MLLDSDNILVFNPHTKVLYGPDELTFSINGTAIQITIPSRKRMATDNKNVPKAKRKPSAYSMSYGKAFKKVAPKYKLKNGSWGKDGFKRAQKAAHKLAKK